MKFGGSEQAFEDVDQRYAELKRLREAREITEEEFDEQLRRSMVQDEAGRWWVKSRKSGEWHYHDGRSWVRGTPPGYDALSKDPGVLRSIRERWSSWLPARVAPLAAGVLGIAVVVALFFVVQGSVWAKDSGPLDLTKILQRYSKGAQTPPEEAQDPTAPASPSSQSPALSPAPSDFLWTFLSTWESPSLSASDAQRPQTTSSAAPSPSSTSGGAGACQQQTNADDFAQALDFSDAKSLADYLGIEGGKDKLAQVLRDCNDLEDLASSLGFSSPERLAQYLGLDSSEKLAERLGVEKGELSTFFNSATTNQDKAATDEGESTTNTDKPANDNGKSTTDNGISTGGNGSSETSATGDGGSAAKGAAGDEAPSPRISTPLSPSPSLSPSPPPPPPKGSEPSSPAAKEPSPVTEDASSPLTTNEPPSETPILTFDE